VISDKPIGQLFIAFVLRASYREFVAIDKVFNASLQAPSMESVLALWDVRHLNIADFFEAHVALSF
jgi:hypothetical protein